MTKIADQRYYTFSYKGNSYVLESTINYAGIATALGMGIATVTNGVVDAGQGDVISRIEGANRGILVPLTINYRNATNSKKRGRAKVAVPVDQLENIKRLKNVPYGSENTVTSCKFSITHDFN